MLVKCYMSAHRFSEPNSWTQSLFFKWKVHIDIISKYKVFCTTANTQVYCQPEKYTFLQINSNKNITWDLTVIFQQRGSTEKGLHVIPTMGVREEIQDLRKSDSLPISHYLQPSLTSAVVQYVSLPYFQIIQTWISMLEVFFHEEIRF